MAVTNFLFSEEQAKTPEDRGRDVMIFARARVGSLVHAAGTAMASNALIKVKCSRAAKMMERLIAIDVQYHPATLKAKEPN